MRDWVNPTRGDPELPTAELRSRARKFRPRNSPTSVLHVSGALKGRSSLISTN